MNDLAQLDLPQLALAVANLGVDHLPTFGGVFEGGYLIQQNPMEFAEFLIALSGRTIRSYLQIGIAAGGAERLICEYLGCKNLHIIDDGNHRNFSHWATNREALRCSGIIVHEHIGNSHSPMAARFLDESNITFDLIGIDGDHTEDGVSQDWRMIQSVTHPGSIVWFHDTSSRLLPPNLWGPHKLWTQLRTEHHVLFETQTHCGIGALRL